MIIITGATGSIGRYLVAMLRDRGAPVRAFVRDRERARDLGVPYVVGDLASPSALAGALVGAERVVLNSSPSAEMVAHQRAAIDAAARAGVSQIVRISSAGATPDSPRTLGRWHGTIDAHLAAAGVAWAALRPTYFMQNLLASAPAVRTSGGFIGAYGDGRIAMIDARDIAACAAALVTSPIATAGPLTLTGREAVSFAEIAARLGALLGTSVAYLDQPVEQLLDGMRTRGLGSEQIAWYGELMRAFAAGGAAHVTSTVAELLGRPARTVDEFFADHLDAFRRAA